MSKKKSIVASLIETETAPEISGNFALLVFPTDKWGLTTDLKAASRHLSGRICGSEDKYQLVIDTLNLLIRHIDARYQEDSERLKNV